ncbi:hypothetical protein POTOM_034239 [Populus tomentosa]|uniref:Uncharacterized protein n=1 Tax=Populus tomentosa TaxID=118781 RepID=A0A8X8CP11_POPTO|nr:hypothetical protein POTOM_034239 [Populus tomentosa]
MMVDVHINIVVNNNNSQSGHSHMSTMQRLNLTSPLRIVINGSSRMAISPPPQPPLHQPHNCDWSFNFYFPPLNISASVLRLAWTAEVMRHVISLTVSERLFRFYLCLFVPAIEELIIITRGLILLEGEDEFMFACAHCCLGIMESTFRHGND